MIGDMKTNTERLEFYYNQGFEFILTKKKIQYDFSLKQYVLNPERVPLVSWKQ